MDGEVVHRAGYGIADMDHSIPITPKTVFDIASISKQFGAMAALLLEAEGRLDLEEDVRAYVPALPDFGPTIVPRHLIHHTSGIRDWPHTMELGGVGYSDVISFEKILRMLYQQRAINFRPGSEYAYSNTGYNLLARMIEVQSGMTFRAYTQEQIFSPLRMTHTHFSDDYLEIVPGRAESYAPVGNEADGMFRRQINQLTALASSSLNTTVDDFILWMKNYETGEVGGEEIIGRMLQRGVLTGGDTIDYAHGLTVGEYRGLTNFGHGGSWAGFRTNFLRFSEEDLSIVVFCNFSTCDPGGRALKVAEVFLEDQMGPPPVQPDGSDDVTESLSLSDSELREYSGHYRSPELDSTYEVFVESGRLVAEHWRNPPSILSPIGDDLFTGDRRWFPEVRFIRNQAGQVAGFTVSGVRVRALMFERVQ
jgi:CubicO group peptidase (beta-lactamase class C family)